MDKVCPLNSVGANEEQVWRIVISIEMDKSQQKNTSELFISLPYMIVSISHRTIHAMLLLQFQ